MLVAIACLASVTYAVAAAIVGPPAVVADGITYSTSAIRLLNTGVYTSYSLKIDSTGPADAMQAPGYTLLLAAIYRFLPHTGDPIEVIARAIPAIVALHFLCTVLAAVLIAVTGHLVGGLRTGWIAGVLAALYLPFGAETMSAWPESVRLMLGSACILMSVGLFRAEGPKALRWMVGFAITGGLTALVMPAVAPWLAIPLVSWGWRHRAEPRRAVVTIVVGLASVALMLSPWIVRNAIAVHAFVPLTQHVGTVWIDSIGGRQLSYDEIGIAEAASRQGKDAYKAVAFERLRLRWAASPTEFIVWKLDGVWGFLGTPWMSQLNPSSPLSEDTAMVAGPSYREMSAPAYERWTTAMTLLHRILMALGLAGLVLARRRRVAWLIASGPIVALALNAVLLPWSRYFYPWMPAMVVLAALCVSRVLDIASERRSVDSASA